MDEILVRLSKARDVLDQQTAELQPISEVSSMNGDSEYEHDAALEDTSEIDEQDDLLAFEDDMANSSSRDNSENARRPRALFDALDSIEQSRGNAATPLTALQGTSDVRASINQLHSLILSRASQKSQSPNRRAPQATPMSEFSIGAEKEIDRNSSTMSNNSGSLEGQNNSVQHRDQSGNQRSYILSLGQLATYLQNELIGIQQNIMGASAVPRETRESLVADLRLIRQKVMEKHSRVQREGDRVNLQNAQLLGQLEEARHQIRTSEENRYRERDTLQKQILELKLKVERSNEKLAETELRWKAKNHDLTEKLAVQEEQLEGKRALWMSANPGSSARRDAMTAVRDPFTSPTSTHPSRLETNRASSTLGSSTISSALTTRNLQDHTTSTAVRRVPTLRRRPHLQLRQSEPQNIEPGNSPPRASLVLHKTPDEEIRVFQDLYTRLYGIIEGWVKSYASIPSVENDLAIAQSPGVLWSYMISATYSSHRQDSHTYVMGLLANERTRIWFVMRILVQYCIREILSVEAFVGYNSLVYRQIHEAQENLKERGLANEARQVLIDQQCKAVLSILGSYDYSIFRSKQLASHTQSLRDLVGPLLTSATIRTDAGRDLGVLVINAWELSVKMWTSHLSFQIYFPETNSKFNAATMAAKDRLDTDPMQLQIAQTRLKLIITPVITLRDDRRTTIVVNNLKHAMVLTMA